VQVNSRVTYALLQTKIAICVTMEIYKFPGVNTRLQACLTAMVTSISYFRDQQTDFSLCISYGFVFLFVFFFF
jgi:hypothetical protein